MATTYVGKNAPIRGPYLKHAFAKYVLKGEDAWLQQRDVDNTLSSGKGVPHAAARPSSIQAAALSSIYIPALARLKFQRQCICTPGILPSEPMHELCLPTLQSRSQIVSRVGPTCRRAGMP